MSRKHLSMQDRDELLVRIDERVDTIIGRLDDGHLRMNGHSERIRKLELWRSRIIGAVSIIGLLVGLIARAVL